MIKCVGVIHAENFELDLERTDGVYSTRTVAIDDGDYYIDELLEALEDAANTFSEWTLTLSLSSSGKVTITTQGGVTGEITWSSTDLRDALGFDDAGLVIGPASSPDVAPHTHLGGLYLDHGLLLDEPRTTVRRGIKRSGSTVFVDVYEIQVDHKVAVRIRGWYRSDTRTSFHEYRDFMMSHFLPGEPFRLYPDASVDAPYEEVSEPYGYMTVVGISPENTGLRQLVPGTYAHLSQEWELAKLEE